MPNNEIAVYFAVAALCGVLVEAAAGILRLWKYKSVFALVSNIVVMFGLVQGVCVAGLVGYGQAPVGITPVLFMVGAVIGIFYEGLNEYAVPVWSWPNTPLFGLTASRDKAAAIGVAWGAVPALVNVVAHSLAV